VDKIGMSDLTLSGALGRAGREIGRLHEIGLELQDAVVELSADASAAGGATLHRLQYLDQLTQELDDLSQFVAELSHAAGDGGTKEVAIALERLKMITLKSRLMDEFTETQMGSDVDLF